MAYTPGASADAPDRSTATAATAARSGRRTLLPPRVPLVDGELLVVEAHVASVDDHVRDRGANLQRVALADDQVRDLAGLDAADLIGDAENLRGVDGERPQGLRARQAPGDRA